MAVPVARVHLKVAHAALPALLPTPPKWKMLPTPTTTPPPCLASVLRKPPPGKPGRADTDERWDAHKARPACPASSSASSSSGRPRSAGSVMRSSSPCKNVTSPPPPMPGRADSVERWDAHKKKKKAGSPASSSPSSLASSCKWPWPISHARATSDDVRWDVHKKQLPPQAEALDDGDRSSTVSNEDDVDMETEEEEEEEILWKPRAMYSGPGFVVATPKSSMLPMPTALLVTA